jgi:16S rRNA (guanine527-N7)-methyltransferase
MNPLARELQDGLRFLALDVPPEAQERLLAYIALLVKWNRTYNLTSVREPRDMLALHVLDSLSVLSHLPPGTLADVGSGGGLPGIPLAICERQRRIVLLESNQKKSAFQRQVQIELGLSNLEVVCKRAEDYVPQTAVDVVISRAFASIADFIKVAGHLCGSQGVMAAMKGVFPEGEIAEIPPMFHVEQSTALEVPGVEGARHLILIRRT